MKRFLLLAIYSVTRCVTPSHDLDQAPPQQQGSHQESATGAPAPTHKPIDQHCRALGNLGGGEPLYIKTDGFVVTAASKKCDLPNGQKGVKDDSDFVVMGFPCSGGDGMTDWRGTNYTKPKMVRFLLETNCKLHPNDWASMKSAMEKFTGASLKGKMIAHNPFMVQYWNLIGYDESDASQNVELRTNKSLDDAWVRFSAKQQPLQLRLVGRENAWNQSDVLYAVSAEILWTSKNRFKIHVLNVEKLDAEGVQKVKKECEALKPPRECHTLS